MHFYKHCSEWATVSLAITKFDTFIFNKGLGSLSSTKDKNFANVNLNYKIIYFFQNKKIPRELRNISKDIAYHITI